MARTTTLLTSASPTNLAPAKVTIGHVQLRDVIICPRERGVVNYVQKQSILEHNINAPGSAPRTLAELTFVPNALASIQVPGTDNTLIAAGGQEAEIHLSLHGPPSSDESPILTSQRRRNDALWQFEESLLGSINNSVLLTSMNLARSHESSVEPRVGVSNNDLTVKFYDVPVRRNTPPQNIHEVGILRLDVPVNHSSLSPDGRTLLSVGDSPKVYLHRLSGGSRLTFTPITTLSLPPPDVSSLYYSSSSLAASFSTSFSSNGTKFAVASQEGAVVVWDVRSSKPLKIFQTDQSRMPSSTSPTNGGATGWLSDDPWDWTRGGCRAPGWGVRSVKFGSDDSGREIMAFTEHTSLLHVIDARTFEMEEIVQMPSCTGLQPPPVSPVTSPAPQSRSTSRSISPMLPSSSSRSHSHSPHAPRIVVALRDTFRNPGTQSDDPRTSLSATMWRASRLRNRTDANENTEAIVVIPHHVRQLSGRHRIRTQDAETVELSSSHAHSALDYDEETAYDAVAEDERFRQRDPDSINESMEVDELESDCISSHTPSRSSSPSPSTHLPLQISPSPLRLAQRYDQRRPIVRKDDLDLAGMCFDPRGGFIYVASVDGVAEWSVSGAEKRWWFESRWA